jgi:hypothetical protein
MRKNGRAPANLLDLKPRRLVTWKEEEDQRVTLIVPRFRSPRVARFFAPFLRDPNFRVRLDAMGSTVWLGLDGETDVGTIADRVRERFGASVEPVHDRLGRFIRNLAGADLIELPREASPASR